WHTPSPWPELAVANWARRPPVRRDHRVEERLRGLRLFSCLHPLWLRVRPPAAGRGQTRRNRTPASPALVPWHRPESSTSAEYPRGSAGTTSYRRGRRLFS